MAPIMCVAAALMVGSVVVQATTWSGGGECASGIKPKSIGSLLQTKLQVNVEEQGAAKEEAEEAAAAQRMAAAEIAHQVGAKESALGRGAVAVECKLGDVSNADYTTSLLQVSMKMHHQLSALHHHHRHMQAAPSGTRILDAYNTCHPHASLHKLAHGDVIIHPASGTNFIHIWKNSGSTILKSVKGSGGYKKRGVIPQIMSNETWFRTALVRDPLKRSLSAFHEIWKRNHCGHPWGTCKGSDCDNCAEDRPVHSKLIKSFKEMLLTKDIEHIPNGVHFLPQVSFLFYSDGSKAALDYIGSMDDGLENEFHFMFDTQVPLVDGLSGGLRQSDLFRIEPAQLPEDVLVLVCNTYHDDYCCFGYDFPDACKRAGFACEGSH